MHASLRFKAVSIAIACAFLASSDHARAYPAYENNAPIPNTAFAVGAGGYPRPCITCHNNADGGGGCPSPPCLNPFGMSVQPAVHNGTTVWTPSVAAADADGDGFTNGQELQDPGGTWAQFTPHPGVAAYVTRPGFPDDSPGLHDADGDRYCWFGRDLDQNGTCTGAGEKTADFDCNDSATSAHSGATEICSDVIDNDCNGQPTASDVMCVDVVDRDHDGFCKFGTDNNHDGNCAGAGEGSGTPVDCDDMSNTRYPGALENCADGLDGNCNNLADAVDPECTGDHDIDGDGYCPVGVDNNADGDCLDSGENTAVSDCNDHLASVNPGIDEMCGDSADNDCDGNADFTDSDCADVTDADGDGACLNGRDLDGDGSCIDQDEGGAAYDCNDMDPLISSLATEICTDIVDQDCDTFENYLDDTDCARYLDTDGDHYCPIGQDAMPYDGNCAGVGEETAVNVDCDDSNSNVSPAQGESLARCLNGLDDNCNGLPDAEDFTCVEYADKDFDGFCAVGRDNNADFDCADAAEQTADSDSAPLDGTVYPGAPENCFDHKDNDQDGFADFQGQGTLPMDPKCRQDIDADGDGACPVGRDVNGDGDCLDTGENYRESDCNDGNPTISPKAVEDYVSGLPKSMQPCFDHIDNDCDGNVNLTDEGCFYVYDDDADGFCRHGIDDTGDGDCLDASEDRGGYDCDDTSEDVRPGANEICDDRIDNDCDSFTDGEDATCECGVPADCDAMQCKTATCTGGTCGYEDIEGCHTGGGKCAVSAPAKADSKVLALALLSLAFAAVGLRRRVR